MPAATDGSGLVGLLIHAGADSVRKGLACKIVQRGNDQRKSADIPYDSSNFHDRSDGCVVDHLCSFTDKPKRGTSCPTWIRDAASIGPPAPRFIYNRTRQEGSIEPTMYLRTEAFPDLLSSTAR